MKAQLRNIADDEERCMDERAECDAPANGCFGALLMALRHKAGLSQMDLALAAGVSTRHVCFLERGRSRASRTMVHKCCDALDADADIRDRLLLAAGFAPDRAEAALTARPVAAWSEPQESLALALAIRREATVRGVLSVARSHLRTLGLEEVFAAECASIGVEVIERAAQSDAVPEDSSRDAALRLAQQLIRTHVQEALQRVDDGDR
jgi:transcriptional regulator with XRE-family HTH domain